MLSGNRSLTCSRLMVAALLCCVAGLWGGGCRKSATEPREEKGEEPAHLGGTTPSEGPASPDAQSLYESGKEFQRAGRYKDAVDAWAKAIEADERMELIVALAKNAMADEMIAKAHYQMHRPYENPAYPRSSRQLLDLIIDEQSGFLEKHVEKANAQLAEWEWITRGWETLYRAQRLIDSYQLGEALDLLESIRDNYPGTLLADRAIPLLKQYGRE